MRLTVAFGTHDGKKLTDEHYGQSTYFDIYEISEDEIRFVERRNNPQYEEDESKLHGDPGKARTVMSVHGGVQVAVGKRFGPNITRMLKKIACVVVRGVDTIDEAAQLVQKHLAEVAKAWEAGEGRKHVTLKAEN